MFSFRFRNCCFSNEIMSEILKIGIPTLAFQLLTSLSITMINMQAKPYGDSVIAGMGAVTRISLGSLMVFGFIKGFQPIAGYNYGAGTMSAFMRQSKDIRGVVPPCSAQYSDLLWPVSGPVISTVYKKNDMEMIRMGQKALKANGLSFLLFGFYRVFLSVLALGKAGGGGLFLGHADREVGFVPIILVFPALWGLNGILMRSRQQMFSPP